MFRCLLKTHRSKRRRQTFAAAALLTLAAALGTLAANAAPDTFQVERVADGDYAHFGTVAMTSPANAGDIANLGIIVGRDGVVLVDTGGSVAVGRALLAAARRLSDRPIRYVVNTHEHPDHVFGNAAVVGTGAVFVGHRNLAASLAAHGPFYLKSYRTPLGGAAIADVQLVEPTVPVDGTMKLDLGDRTLTLTAWPNTAHSDCDLTVLDDLTHTLYAGDLVFIDHTPVIDGSLKGWLDLLPRLAALPALRVVPGHGHHAADWPAALDGEAEYLHTLRRDARRLVAAGVPLADAVPQIGQSERGRWALFDDYNPRNATVVYTELEWEQ